MKWIEFIQRAMSDSKTSFPSTKRMGYVIGVLVAAITSFTVLGVVVGLSINVSAIQFQFVYSTLNETLLWIIGFLIAGGTHAYVSTKNTETKARGNITNDT